MSRESDTSLLKKYSSVDLTLLVAALLLTCHAALVVLNGRINPDEIEHIHTAWYIKNGYLPFVDFFQHHSPLFWYLLVPFPGLSAEDPQVIIHARVLMALITVMTAVMASVCGGRIGQSRTHGLLVYVIMMSVVFYVEKSTSIRPDGLGTLLAVISFYFFLRADDGDRGNIILTGLFVALAFLVTQKAVFFYAFYLLFYTIKLIQKKIDSRTLLLFMLILCSPIIIAVVYGLMIGGLQEYLFCNYLLNVSKRSISRTPVYLLPTFKESWFFWAVSFIGVVCSMLKRNAHRNMMLSSLLGTTIFAAAFSTSFYLQYYIPVIPFFSVTSSILILESSKALGRRRWLLITLIICGYLCAPALNLRKVKHSRNAGRLEMIKHFSESTSHEDCVYDEKRAFNLFRRDAHYLWYHPRLRRQYIDATGKYESFNRCKIIQDKRPAVVDARPFNFSQCKVYSEYQESEYEGFYVIKKDPS